METTNNHKRADLGKEYTAGITELDSNSESKSIWDTFDFGNRNFKTNPPTSEEIEQARLILESERQRLINGPTKSTKSIECEDGVIEKIKTRREIGRKKYGVSMERTDLSHYKWLNHLQEELMDAAIYTERLLREERLRELSNADKLLM